MDTATKPMPFARGCEWVSAFGECIRDAEGRDHLGRALCWYHLTNVLATCHETARSL